LDWGSHSTAVKTIERRGKRAKTVSNKPTLPWYYEVFLTHFKIMSRSRVNGMDGPNPIDIPTILNYNEKIAKVRDPELFLHIIQELDYLYMRSK